MEVVTFFSSAGVFITHGDVGVGTIVGSAVFNILCIVGVCGLFAGQVSKMLFFVEFNCLYLIALHEQVLEGKKKRGRTINKNTTKPTKNELAAEELSVWEKKYGTLCK